MAVNTIDVVVRLVDQISGRLKNVTRALKEVEDQGQKVDKTTTALATALKGLTLIGVYQGLSRVADALVEVVRAGAELDRVADAFRVMTNLGGQDFVAVLGDMRAAARGTVSDIDLMLSANKALSLGVANSAEELSKLVEVSSALGRRTGLGQEQALERLMVGIGRMSPRILDDLGIAVNLTRLFREETGKASSELDQATKIQILLNKVLKDGEEIIKGYPDGLDDTMSAFERLSAAKDNFLAGLGQSGPFEAIAKGLQSVTMNNLVAGIRANADRGKASIGELQLAIEHYEDKLRDAEKANKVFANQGTNIAMYKRFIDELTASLHLATIEARSFRKEQDLITDAVARPQYDKISKQTGGRIFDVLDQLNQAKKDLAAVSIGSDQNAIDKYTEKVEYLQERLERLGFTYNIAAEELGTNLLDIENLKQGVLLIQAETQAYDIFAEAEDKVTAKTKLSAEAQEELNRKIKETEHAYIDLIAAKKAAFQGDVIELAVSDNSAGAANASRQASANLLGNLERIQSMVTAGMYSEQQALIEISRAYEAANGVLEQYVQTKEQSAKTAQDSSLINLGTQILNLLPQLQAGIDGFSSFGDVARGEAAEDIRTLQDELARLANQYNIVAQAAGLPMIDVDEIQRGALAFADAAQETDIFNRAQANVPGVAEAARMAVQKEADEIARLRGIISGFASSFRSQIEGMADVFNDVELQDRYNQGLADRNTMVAEAIRQGGSAEDIAWRIVDGEQAIVQTFQDEAAAIRAADSDAADYADTINNKLKTAFESLNAVVSGELMDSLNELSDVGIGQDEIDAVKGRKDVPAENARRLAAIMNEGIKDQPWLEELKNELPEVWKEITESGDARVAAATILEQFQQGLRPELIDFGQLKEQIKQKIETQLRMEDMGKQLTAELIAEMGTDQSAAIQKFVGDALGTGIEESPFGTDASAKLLSQFNSVDFAEQMKTAGGVSAQNWALGFNNDVPEYMLPFIDILASYVLPIVQANIVATATATGSK